LEDFFGHINKQVSKEKIRSGKGEEKILKPIRIQKLLAARGICSRRKAESLVELGQVEINGSPAKTGQKVDPSQDTVKVKGKILPFVSPKAICLVMNKPAGYVCTNDDPTEKKTVFDLLPKQFAKTRLFCAGRLDKDTEGLLVLTNNGDLAHQLTHPSNQTRKVYQAEVLPPVDPRHLPLFCKGKVIDGDRLWLDKVVLLGKSEVRSSRRLEIRLGHGKKREIRRLLEAFGYKVTLLRRTKVSFLTIRKIPKGGFRLLSEGEIDLLFSEKGRSSRA